MVSYMMSVSESVMMSCRKLDTYLCSALDILSVAGNKAGLVLVVGGHFAGDSV
jgi:hypothetical protein